MKTIKEQAQEYYNFLEKIPEDKWSINEYIDYDKDPSGSCRCAAGHFLPKFGSIVDYNSAILSYNNWRLAKMNEFESFIADHFKGLYPSVINDGQERGVSYEPSNNEILKTIKGDTPKQRILFALKLIMEKHNETST